MRFGRRQHLTTAQQFVRLRGNCNSVGNGGLWAGRLTWRCQVRPTPLSRIYNVRVEYQQGKYPNVYVESPSILSLADGRKIPHLYSQEKVQLCLWHPKLLEWDGSRPIDEYIVPWIALWLFYFEEWLASDEWKGGGQHPEPGASNNWRPRGCGASTGRPAR
jgi:hypothetical protein